MTYGSESECATHYTTARPTTFACIGLAATRLNPAYTSITIVTPDCYNYTMLLGSKVRFTSMLAHAQSAYEVSLLSVISADNRALSCTLLTLTTI